MGITELTCEREAKLTPTSGADFTKLDTPATGSSAGHPAITPTNFYGDESKHFFKNVSRCAADSVRGYLPFPKAPRW